MLYDKPPQFCERGIQVSVQPNALVGKYALNQKVPYQMNIELHTSSLQTVVYTTIYMPTNKILVSLMLNIGAEKLAFSVT